MLESPAASSSCVFILTVTTEMNSCNIGSQTVGLNIEANTENGLDNASVRGSSRQAGQTCERGLVSLITRGTY